VWFSGNPEWWKEGLLLIIEILPENHADVNLTFYQPKGISSYDRQGRAASLDQKRKMIDYC
jgi:hypothetical protein